MMNKIFKFGLGLVALSALSCSVLSAQTETDVFSLSRTDIKGTARYRALGGAFAALGGDLSAITQNPAGGAVFHKSEIAFSVDLGSRATTASWYGDQSKASAFNANMPQIGFVSSYYNARSGNGFSFAINRNNVVRFDRSFDAQTNEPGTDLNGTGLPFSLADYIAHITPEDLPHKRIFSSNKGVYNADVDASWLTILGYEAGLINPIDPNGSAGPYVSGFWYPSDGKMKIWGPSRAVMEYQERGSVDVYDFNFSYNHGDKYYIGASLKYASISKTLFTRYGEDFRYSDFTDYLKLDNQLSTQGSGFGLSIGAILRPIDGLRLGVAYHSPTWMELTDRYQAQAESLYRAVSLKDGTLTKYNFSGRTPAGSTSYSLVTPSRFVFGLAYTFGSRALISFDYDLVPYSSMRLKFPAHSAKLDNKAIQSHYALQHTMRMGGEVRVLPSLSLRVGGAYSTTPMKEGNGLTEFQGSSQTPILVSGTLPHYTIQKAQWMISGGLGYRISKSFYLDASVQREQNDSFLYAFPALSDRNGKVLSQDYFATPEAIKLSNSNIYATITFGYKF